MLPLIIEHRHLAWAQAFKATTMSSKADNDAMMEAVWEGDKPTCERLLAKDKKLKNAKNGVRKGNTAKHEIK